MSNDCKDFRDLYPGHRQLTQEELNQYGRRAVASSHWKWMERMAVYAVMADGSIDPDIGTVLNADWCGLVLVYWPNLNDGRGRERWDRSVRCHDPETHLIPALGDAATRGCVLDLIRGVEGHPCIHPCWNWADGWGILAPERRLYYDGDRHTEDAYGLGGGDIEIGALVTTLEEL